MLAYRHTTDNDGSERHGFSEYDEHRKFSFSRQQDNDRRNPDAYRKAQEARESPRTKIVSISCVQDLYSLIQVNRGLPVNPSEFRALNCRRTPPDFV